MSGYTHSVEILALTSRAAATTRTRLDVHRVIGAALLQAKRTTAAPVQLEIHLDRSALPNPDATDDLDWDLDAYGGPIDLAASDKGVIEVTDIDAIPRWLRARIVHAGIDVTFGAWFDGKGIVA